MQTSVIAVDNMAHEKGRVNRAVSMHMIYSVHIALWEGVLG